jgi:hypothetical protein
VAWLSRAPLAGESVDEVAFPLGHRDANVTRAVYVRELSDGRRRTMHRSRMVAEFADLLRAQNGDQTQPHAEPVLAIVTAPLEPEPTQSLKPTPPL